MVELSVVLLAVLLAVELVDDLAVKRDAVMVVQMAALDEMSVDKWAVQKAGE